MKKKQPTRASRKRILWVEQDNSIENHLEFLTLNGYEVLQEGSLTKAEALIKDMGFDCIIVDMMMIASPDEERHRYRPELTHSGLQTGLVFIERISKFLDTHRTKIMVLTNRPDNHIRNKCISIGISRDGFVVKSDVEEESKLLFRLNFLLESREVD